MCYSCFNIEENEQICILQCNPQECLFLDEEKCECVPDPVCETEKFCGGDIENCGCKEKDGGGWCTALTGDSIKTWKFAYLYDSIRYDTAASLAEVFEFMLQYIYDYPMVLYDYRLDHFLITFYEEDLSYENYDYFKDMHVYTWEFDNLIQPTKIIYTKPDEYWPYRGLDEFERKIIKLSPDTLITTWHEGIFPGWIVLVPNDG